MKRSDYRFAERLRVRWAEIDAQKIVFNAHYLMYVDTAVAAYWRALVMPYAETMHSLDGDLYVKKATLEYHGSARYDEQLEVGVRCVRVGTSSMLFHAGVFRGASLLVSAELVYVFADPATQTSRPVPQSLRDVLQSFEAGEPMVEVQAGDWSTLGNAVRALRQRVFVDEMGLADSFLQDPIDATCDQLLVRNRFGLPVGCGRATVLPEQAGGGIASGQLSRLVVLPLLRGAGVGRALVHALETRLAQRGVQRVELTAAAAALGFYERLGYRAEGDRFDEAGLEHQRMVKRLDTGGG